MTNVYLEKIAEMLDKEAATREQKKARLKRINADQKARTKANKSEGGKNFTGPVEGERKGLAKVKHKWQSLSSSTQKKLKIGGAIGGAAALAAGGYAAMNHEKAAEAALLIEEGFSPEEAFALLGE